MKINLIQTLITAWLSISVLCLHLQQQQRVYDPNQYLNSLQQTQDQFHSDLLQIQKQFAQIDQSIKNAANDPLQQLRVYSEGVADERDSLYSIQQYLKIPYNQRACKCFNFTQQLRKNLTNKISQVGNQLTKIYNKSKQCSDCQIDIQIEKQIEYQKSYLKIMQDTVDAKCCTIYKILYVDNVNSSSNFLYGNLTPENYLKQMNQKAKNASTNETLVRQCPLQAPFASDNLQKCSSGCQNQNQLFDLQTRKCTTCPIGKIYNYQKHTCDYDVVCPEGSQFNQNTVMCEKVYIAYNGSLCPPEAPVWNQQALGCFKCDIKTPYYDVNIGKCTSCPANYSYNTEVSQCVYDKCQAGQTYNIITKKCETQDQIQGQGQGEVQLTSSNCPFDRPYWDKSSLSCSRCPSIKPFYNSSIKACQTCPKGSNYDLARNLCTVICAAGQQLNAITLVCQNITEPIQPQPSNGSFTSVCPPDRPIWNAETKSCSQCNAATPFWNEQTGKCQICPVNQIWNSTTNSCQNQAVIINCPPGTNYNPSTKSCEKSTGSMAFCPPQKPWYNTAIMACLKCPLEQPNYNISTNQCTGGKSPTKPSPQANETTIQTPTCPSGYIFVVESNSCQPSGSGGIIAICPPQKPMWDVNTGTCKTCPPGQQWNPNMKACVTCASGSQCSHIITTPTNTQTNPACQYNYQWNATLLQCIKCLPYQKYNTKTKRCDNFCNTDQVYNSNYDICSGTVSRCPLGLIFNQQKLRCECSQGANYKYDSNNFTCTKFCKTNEYYDYLDQKCYPL